MSLSRLLVVAGSPWCFLTYRQVAPISAFVSTRHAPVCTSVPPYGLLMRTSVFGLEAQSWILGYLP